MPHDSRYEKTRDGYIVEIESLLEMTSALPKAFYRLKISQAQELHEAALFLRSNPQRWIDVCKKFKLPLVVSLPPIETPETALLTRKDWKLIHDSLIARKKKLAIHAHTWERAQIGSEKSFTEYNAINELLARLGYLND